MNKKLLVITTLSNTAYAIWLGFHITGFYGWFFYGAEVAVSSLSLIFFFNHWSQKHTRHSHLKAQGSVDIFIPVVNEPLDIFEPVLKKALGIDYKDKKIYILDDGHRQSVKKLAEKYGINYISRQKRRHYKAGNLNHALKLTDGDYILVIDADQEITDKNILKDLLGHFKDNENLAMISTRQKFKVTRNDFNHDYLFYEHMQTGKNNDNAAISCGSGVVYSRRALNEIEGFQTWNVVEDLYTSYQFHLIGFETLYVNKSYTLGTAPRQLVNIYKQRGTWALDTLRLFFKDSPIFKRQLSFRQKIHYFEIACSYIVSAVAIPILFITPSYALLTDSQFITSPGLYLLFRIPTLILIIWLYFAMSSNTFSTSQWWAGLWPAYLKGLILAILPGKPKYKVTSKAEKNQRDILLVIPHIIIIIMAYIAISVYLQKNGLTYFLMINVLWIALMIFWFTPVVERGLTKDNT
jgi:cellulose synthase (UDP-forming)